MSNDIDRVRYEEEQQGAEVRHEALCRRCGTCCGAGDDPCAKLARAPDGAYYCVAYETRIGPQATVLGKPFTCVPIRDVLTYAPPRPGCGYARSKKS